MRFDDDTDGRLSNFVNMTPESVRVETDTWPRPTNAPEPVQGILQEARRLMVGGATTYPSFVAAVRTGFEATEVALKHLLGRPGKNGSLGQLLNDPRVDDLLTERQAEWYRLHALRFRNDLAHPDDAAAYSPGMAAGMLLGIHRAMCDVFSEPVS